MHKLDLEGMERNATHKYSVCKRGTGIVMSNCKWILKPHVLFFLYVHICSFAIIIRSDIDTSCFIYVYLNIKKHRSVHIQDKITSYATLDFQPCGHSCILALSYAKAWCTSHVNCMVLKLAVEKPDLA